MKPNKLKGLILCVDDNIEFCRLIIDFFLERGYDVIPALSAEEGYEVIKKNKIDMLLLDIRMSGMGGLGLIKKLKEEKTEIPTLVITAFPDDIPIIESVTFPIYGYFDKPIDLGLVYKTVEECMKKYPPQSKGDV